MVDLPKDVERLAQKPSSDLMVPDEVRDYLGRILSSQEIIKQHLFSVFGLGHGSDVFDVGRYVFLWRGAFERAEIALDNQVNGQSGLVLSDYYGRILGNALGNVLVHSVDCNKVSVRAYREGEYCMLAVENNGTNAQTPEHVRQTAIELGIIDPSSALGNSQVMNLVYDRRFSTLEHGGAPAWGLSEGQGLSTIKKYAEQRGGFVRIGADPEQDVAFRLEVAIPLEKVVRSGFM